MDIARMRLIDKLIGNPLCRTAAAVKRVSRPSVPSPVEVKNIVVMKFFGMGSIVVASPALTALRDQFPGARIHFVTFEQHRPLLDVLGLTDHNHYIDPATPTSFARTALRAIRALRAAGCELAIDLEFFAKFPLGLATVAGIPRKAGFHLQSEAWRRTLLDVSGIYNHYFHTKDIFLSLPYLIATGDHDFLGFAEFSSRYGYPRVTPSTVERAALRRKLAPRVGRDEPIFVVNANTSPDLAPNARKWPEARYAELARRLLKDNLSACVAFIGTASERAYVDQVVERVGSPRAFSTAGELSLRELLALFAEAALVVSNDSGPMHVACLVDAPIVGLFFGDTPTLFAPIGSRVRVVVPPLYSIPLYTVYNGKEVGGGRLASEITNAVACTVSVDDVMAAIEAVLSAPANAADTRVARAAP